MTIVNYLLSPRPIEWLGAIAGSCVITVNLLDGFLSPQAKDQFRGWIDRTSPMVEPFSVGEVYLSFRKHKWSVWVLISLIMPIYLFATLKPLRELGHRNATFGMIWAIWFIECLILFWFPFKRADFRASLRSFSRVFVFSALPTSLVISLAFTILSYVGHRTYFASHNFVGFWFITTVCMLIACIGLAAIQYGLVILVVAMRIPTASVTRTVWWIAGYPQGVWEVAALISSVLYLLFFLVESVKFP